MTRIYFIPLFLNNQIISKWKIEADQEKMQVGNQSLMR